MLVTLEKELGEYFERLLFWNQWVPLIKMYSRVRHLFDFNLKICSGKVWQGLHTEELKKIYEYVAFYAKGHDVRLKCCSGLLGMILRSQILASEFHNPNELYMIIPWNEISQVLNGTTPIFNSENKDQKETRNFFQWF